MSTNSLIGTIKQDGTVEAVYCHWDGYPEHVGKILKKHYQNPSKVKELLALGDLSSLGENVHPPKHSEHSFDKPLEGVTVAYHRDRDEPSSSPFKYENIEDYLNTKDYQYLYLFKDGTWYCHNGSALVKL